MHQEHRHGWDYWSQRFTRANHRQRGDLIASSGDLMDDESYWRGIACAWQDCERQSLAPAVGECCGAPTAPDASSTR